MYIKLTDIIKFRVKLKTYPVDRAMLSQVVVMNTVRSVPLILHQEMFLAKIFALSGAKVIMLVDDGILSHWDTFQVHDNVNELNPSKLYFQKIKHVLARQIIRCIYWDKKIKYVKYSEYLSPKNSCEVTTSDKNNAVSSVRRYFENGTYDKNDSAQRSYYERSLLNCEIGRNVGRNIINKYSPQLFITSHGIYSTWSSMYEEFKNHNILSLVYGANVYRRNHLLLTPVLAQILSTDPRWKKHSNTPLTNDNKEKVIAYFNSRINHQTKDTKAYYGGYESSISIQNHSTEGQVVFGLFPNIIWDGDIVDRDKYFDGIIDWVLSTIKLFMTLDHVLVVRYHPAETTLWRGSVLLGDVVEKSLPEAKAAKNIIFIDSATQVDSYQLIINNIDIGLVYDGMLSMEMVHLGKPVITCATTRYNGTKFTYDPPTKAEYIEMLCNPEYILNDFRDNIDMFKRNLYKYAFWFIYLSSYYFPILSKTKYNKIDLSYFPSFKDNSRESNDTHDMICAFSSITSSDRDLQSSK